MAVLRVGLTGGIGSGKSEVSRRLAEHGAVLIDADVAAREVVVPGSPGLARIAGTFGEGVLRPDGSLNRERLGEIVFSDPGLRTKLNEIVHPLVREWMQAAEEAAVRAAARAPAGRAGRRARRPAAGGKPRAGGLRRGDRGGRAARACRPSGWSGSAACPPSRPGPGWPPRPAGSSGWPSPTS